MNPPVTPSLPAAAAAKSRRKSRQRVLLAGALLVAGLVSYGPAAQAATSQAPAPAAVAGKGGVRQAAKPKDLKKPPKPAAPAKAVALPVAAERAAPPVAEPAAPAPPTTRTQAGRVLDEAGQPLVGATVLLKGSAKGTSTDANGSYSFEVPAGENTFIFGYGGYEDEVAKGHDGQPLTVTLLPTPGKDKMRKKRR